MNNIDLHIHSSASDGTLTPSQIVALAIRNHLSAIALTDHDTVDGIEEAKQAVINYIDTSQKLIFIPGIELSVGYKLSGKDKDIHIVGLFLDTTNQTFLTRIQEAAEEREQRNIKMAKNLQQAGIDISVEKIKELVGESVITRAHFAKYLTHHHYTKTLNEAFSRYLNEDGAYYVSRKYLTPKESISLIRMAGGIPILAHPLLYHVPMEELDSIIAKLTEYGLMGLEAFYSANQGYDEQNMKRLAKKYNLLLSGGSDFHGTNKPAIQLGRGYGNLKVPYTILEKLLDVQRTQGLCNFY